MNRVCDVCPGDRFPGATFIDPTNTYVDGDVKIGKDTIVWPGVSITNSEIGENCKLIQGAAIVNSFIGIASTIMGLVQNSLLAGRAFVGRNAELQRTKVGLSFTAKHNCYLGDFTGGIGINIGEGTVTGNADGLGNKHKTIMGHHVFVGIKTKFLPPITIGSQVYIAGGLIIDQDIPNDSAVMPVKLFMLTEPNGTVVFRKSIPTDYQHEVETFMPRGGFYKVVDNRLIHNGDLWVPRK